MYCMQTVEIYVALYPWFYMPSSVHKILIHGAVIINHASFPIGMMSEAAQESRNKDLRNFREQHTRKNSKKKNIMEDLMHSLLLSSDPLISISQRPFLRVYSQNQIIVDNNAQNLLLEHNIQEDVVCSYNPDSD